MKSLKEIFEDVFDIDSGSTEEVNEVIRKRYDDKTPFPGIKTKFDDESTLLVTPLNPKKCPISDQLFNDMRMIEIKNIDLQECATLQINENVYAKGIKLRMAGRVVSFGYKNPKYRLEITSNKPASIYELCIEPTSLRDYTSILINNLSKFIFEDCKIECNSIHVINPELTIFKNCRFYCPQGTILFQIDEENKYAAQAYIKAANDDYSGLEKLGFSSNNLKLDNFEILYSGDKLVKSTLDEICISRFFYKNSKWGHN